jgi:L-rhamnose-H+ transport protein
MLLKEWKGAGTKTVIVLVTGMAVLIISLILPNIMK